MDAFHLIECLEKTGTGITKLQPAREWADRRNKATGAELFAAMKEQGRWPEMTLEKAEFLLQGGNIAELMGTPPPRSQEASETRLARELGKTIAQFVGTHEDKQADAQEQKVGHPEAIKKRPKAPVRVQSLGLPMGGRIEVEEPVMADSEGGETG